MDQKSIERNRYPDYKKIYTDIIIERFPDKKNDLQIRDKINCIQTTLDILSLNTLIFGEEELLNEIDNQKLRSYDENSIVKILDYQRKNQLSNTATALHFRMSRNTVAKWKIIYKYKI
ncbi:helix-turn-helix domain-containing protein [Chryseobacterium jejuense]|uniref:helix-turn-helix domain-containing protein n=1 Tax=Chryseobacterium jejuense TaxID=445960 RepID=UPI001AE56948|nr:helix-turn-helix domain-containing protein [Chryseobacterium jejuense]MBP2618608.1 DNA-binding transcriptional regulator YiaG [Chryseobacterium jejuense]